GDEVTLFEKELVKKGHVPQRFLRSIEAVQKAKKDYDNKKLGKTELEKIRVQASELIKFLSEYAQRKHNMNIDRAKLRIKQKEQIYELLIGKDIVYLINYTNQTFEKASIKKGAIDKFS